MNYIQLLEIIQNVIGGTLLFFFGAAIGSFVMVASQRLRVKNFLNSRSVCMSCNNVLTWKEMLPILSFIYLRGRCKECKSKIDINLFFIEFFSGVIFAVLPYVINSYTSIMYIKGLIFIMFLIVYIPSLFIFIYDIKHKIINIESLLFVSAFAVISQIGIQYLDNYPGINYFNLLSPLFTSSIFLILFLISRGRWIGFGDILLFIVYGLLLPLPIAISGLFYAIWIGAFISMILYIFNHKYHISSQIPFAPFIVFGFLYAFMTHSDLLSLNFLLNI